MDAVANTALIVNKMPPGRQFRNLSITRRRIPEKSSTVPWGWVRPCTLRWSSSRRRTGSNGRMFPTRRPPRQNRHDGRACRRLLRRGRVRPFAKEGYPRPRHPRGRSAPPSSPTFPTLKELAMTLSRKTLHCVFAPANLPSRDPAKTRGGFHKAIETPEFRVDRRR